MADKKNSADTATVNGQHRVYADPRYGLRLPDAAELAADGVVTNSQDTIGGGETLAVAPGDAQVLVEAGAVRVNARGV